MKQTINIGTVANDGTGDTLRDAFDKTNDNFTESYQLANDAQADADTAQSTASGAASAASAAASAASTADGKAVTAQADIDAHELLTNNPHSVTKSQVGLGSVPNLSFSGSNTGDQDLSGLATTSALTTHTSNTSNPHSVTKSQVGLGSVPNLAFSGTNTGDQDLSSYQTLANKDTINGYPGLSSWAIKFRNLANTFTSLIQNAATAIRTYTFPDKDGTVAMTSDIPDVSGIATNAAAISTHSARTDNPHIVTKTQVGLPNADNTSDANKPLSTADIAALLNKFPVYNVMSYGAKHDYQTVSTAGVTSGSANLTVSSGTPFTSLDTGKSIRVFGAGAAGADLITTMTFVSSTAVTLGVNASTTIANKQIEWGTDDTVPIQNTILACATAGGGTVYLPNGIYCIFGSLQTSIDSINPNCQIYFPKYSSSSTMRRVNLVGESVINLPNSALTAQPLPTQGVIWKSMIVGSGTLPAVLGSSWAFNGATNSSVLTPELHNICIMTKSITGVTHVEPSMTAFMLRYNEAKIVYDCFATTESDPTESVLPSTDTFGFYFDQQLHSDQFSYYNNCMTMGYKYGFRIEEHSNWQRLVGIACYATLQIGGDTNYNPIFCGGVIHNLWCKYGIEFVGPKTLDLNYYSERYPGPFTARWYNTTADFSFTGGSFAYNGVIRASANTTGGSLHPAITVTGTYTGNLIIYDYNNPTSPTYQPIAWTSWTPTHSVGFSVAPTVDATYVIEGKRATVRYNVTANGTSNAGTFTITNWPFIPKVSGVYIIFVVNSGSAAAGRLDITAGSTTVTIQLLTGAFTTSGSKGAQFVIVGEVQ